MQQPKKFLLTEVIRELGIARDYELQQERHWWKWMLFVSIPLLVIVAMQKVFGGQADLSWLLIAAVAVLLIAARIALVWMYQNRRKHWEERIAFHQAKKSEGYTYVTIKDGQQVFLK